MKHFKLFSMLGIVGAFIFSACNGGEEKTEKTASTNDSAIQKTASTVDTTPSYVLVVWHKVADYAKWKKSYDGHDSVRLAFGIHNYVIGRGAEDSNMVLVATKVDDTAKAKAFGKDPSLKAAMQKGGVVGAPEITLNTMLYQDTAQNMSDLRSMTMFTVKDWDAWRKAFESNRQVRTDNGLTDRAYGHDVGDNHKVTLVVAINDTAKANAYWNSDLIKQKRAESGVVGEVKRHVYRVVQKY